MLLCSTYDSAWRRVITNSNFCFGSRSDKTPESTSEQFSKMEEQKALLASLLSNRLDRVSIIFNLRNFKSNFDEKLPYVILKYKLQLIVIEILSNEAGQTAHYSTLKKETEEILAFYNQKEDSRKFQCSLVGCIFQCNTHRLYIRHLRQSHSRETNLICLHGKTCLFTFATMELLSKHVHDVHAKEKSRFLQPVHDPPADIPCKCPRSKCLGSEFASTRSLMVHMRNDHAKEGELVECIFESCDSRYNNAASLKKHFQLKHIKLSLMKLKDVHKIDHGSFYDDESEVEAHNTFVMEEGGSSQDNDEENETESDHEDNEENEEEESTEAGDNDVFLMNYCDFLNRLSNFHFVPQSTIKIIAEEYIKSYSKSNKSKEKVLRKSLGQIPGISEADIKKVLDDVHSDDQFLEAQSKLDTDYKMKQFLKEKFIHVSPIEIVLNPKAVKNKTESKAVIHYVPIIDAFKNLIQDPSFIDVMECNVQNSDTETLKDVKDGHLYRNNPFFKNNPSAYTMMIYSDAIELVNPLGAGRTKHKVIQIFFSLCEIPKHLRSKIDRIQLVAVFKEKLIKKFGFEKIYKQLVKDLKVLELGVKVTHPVERIVKCGVLIHPADNLEAHCVGGYSQSFSSRDICRFCHIQHEDLADNIHDYDSKVHAKWNAEEYDKAAQIVENMKGYDDDDSEEEMVIGLNVDGSDVDSEDGIESGDDSTADEDDEDENVELFGIKHRCPLNSLEAFHSTSAFPPDLLHDVFEGVVSQDLLGIIRVLSRKGWFSIDEYNSGMNSLAFKSHESSDRPQLVPLNNKAKKLIGKACSIWVHMRYFPLIIRRFVVAEDDPVLKLGLKLHEMTERITASEFKEYEIDALEDIIINFLDERKHIYNEYPGLMGTPKPKTHFLTHYPMSVFLYGPPMSYWTARYESRHRIAKNTANSAKNFINISKTISTRQQMRQSSVFYHGMFPKTDIVITGKSAMKSSMSGKSDFEKAILPYMSDSDFLVKEIEVRGQLYKAGQLVVLEQLSLDELRVGLVISILVKEKSAHFVTKQYTAERQALQYYEASSEHPPLTINDVRKIADYKPLINQGTSSQLFFCLHHNISYTFP